MKNNETMIVDMYELPMSQTYFDTGDKDTYVYFDVFFRKNPFNGGYTVSGGLDNIIDFINNFQYTDSDIEYLRSLNKYSEEFLSQLKGTRFTGDLYMVPDGTIVFPNEPVLTVRAKTMEAQLLETALLHHFNTGSLITTAAKRITNEAGDVPVIEGDDSASVMEFGARRSLNPMESAKYGYIGGCVGTSLVKAGKEYNIPILGTMAHSLVTFYENEETAFRNFAKSNPNDCVFLVDTYDTLREGVPNAIKVANEYLKPNNIKFKGIRIDSGDLAYLSKEARKMLDEAGYTDTGICLSNGLNEYTIAELKKQGAKFNSLGVGDNIAQPLDRVGGVYKLVAIERDNQIIPRIKVSNDSIKTINPGYKKLYRFYDKDTGYALGDVVALYDEIIDKDKYTLIHPIDTWKTKEIINYVVRELQVPIFKGGTLVYQEPTVTEKRDYCNKEFKTLYPEITRLSNPHEYYVDLSKELLDLKNKMINEHRERNN
jgi:nicotinate phosphoribosyltransferase